jgi:glycosyltransferase involved in cell wall biosynthesis
MYFFRSKSEVFSIFKSFFVYIETQFSIGIKVLRSDSGGEYMSHEFHNFLQQKGIVSHRSCPYTPQQNGVAERTNRHLLDITRTLLLKSSLPSKFWIEALSTAIYLINRLPSQVLNFDSLCYRLHHKSPSYHDLHTFGYVCFVHLPSHKRYKLSTQSTKCVFLGYSISHKGFVCYDLSCRKFCISRNVVFFENQYFFPTHVAFSFVAPILPHFEDVSSFERFKPGILYERRRPILPLLETDPPPDTAPKIASEPSTHQPALHHSTRVSHPPDQYGFFATLSTIIVPSCYSQAVQYECWQKAMQKELQALQNNHILDLVSCPPVVKPIGCK